MMADCPTCSGRGKTIIGDAERVPGPGPVPLEDCMTCGGLGQLIQAGVPNWARAVVPVPDSPMTVEECWANAGTATMVFGRESFKAGAEFAATGKEVLSLGTEKARPLVAAVRALVLAVHDRAVVLALGNDQMCSESEPCGSCAELRKERAQLEALGEEKE